MTIRLTKSVLLHYRYHMRLGGTIRYLQVNKLNQRYIPREYLSSTCFFPPPFITCYTCTSTCSAFSCLTVLGYNGKSGAFPRKVRVYILFRGCARLLSTLQKKATKRVCMGENLSCCIWGAPDFCVPPCTSTRTHILLDARLALDLASGS